MPTHEGLKQVAAAVAQSVADAARTNDDLREAMRRSVDIARQVSDSRDRIAISRHRLGQAPSAR